MTKLCSVPCCNRQHFGKGLCRAHYGRAHRTGDPQADKPIGAKNGDAVKFFEEIVTAYDGTDCLIWPFARTTQGYARLLGKSACRTLCEEKNGPPPTPEHDAAHSCGKGHMGCISQTHLSWKTKTENAADKIVHGTHLQGSAHPMAKLTEPEIIKTRSLYGKIPAKKLAAMIGVSAGQVRKIGRLQTWSWLEEKTS